MQVILRDGRGSEVFRGGEDDFLDFATHEGELDPVAAEALDALRAGAHEAQLRRMRLVRARRVPQRGALDFSRYPYTIAQRLAALQPGDWISTCDARRRLKSATLLFTLGVTQYHRAPGDRRPPDEIAPSEALVGPEVEAAWVDAVCEEDGVAALHPERRPDGYDVGAHVLDAPVAL